VNWDERLGHHAELPVVLAPGQVLDGYYDATDRAYWEHVNAQPNYPRFGEGNLMVMRTDFNTQSRRPQSRDRRTFGSMAFLFATPDSWGPMQGAILGGLRTNLVYRLFTGAPFEYRTRGLDSRVFNTVDRFFGPIHTRVDLNVEKRFGDISKTHLMLGIEVFNLFNQKDTRSKSTVSTDSTLDFDGDLWVNYGIESFDPVTSAGEGTQEFNDVRNYWDQPRDLKFNVRFKW
jgi:hypothetical protein